MATTASARIYDADSEAEIAVLHCSADGGPSDFGAELKKFARGFVIGAGIPCKGLPEKFANGAGCFAAQLVAHFKTGPGGFYLEGAETGGAANYNYKISIKVGKPVSVRLCR